MFQVYDTTMRDGAQQEGLTLSIADKVAIAGLLDELGVGFIEGGWPGAIPKDTEFFQLARTELELRNAVLVAFGSTRKAGVAAENDQQLQALLDSEASVITLVAKSHPRHVELALRTTLDENLAMIADSVRYLAGHGRRVMIDAEHFFDGYRLDRGYALSVVRTAFDAGAEAVILCDTNGGMLPFEVQEIVADVCATTDGIIGMHAHNDSGCAVANTLAAVKAGAMQVQGCANGYGERTGNADLITVIGDLELKMGIKVLPEGHLAELTSIAHAIAELTNIAQSRRQPYVGASAFAHKAGLHASAIRMDPNLYQHIDPSLVGNDMRMLISDMAGRASIELKGKEMGIDLTGKPETLGAMMAKVKAAEAKGYTYDAADASFELLLRTELDGSLPQYFEVAWWRTVSELHPGDEPISYSTVALRVDGEVVPFQGHGNGPVNALDHALRSALSKKYPELEEFELTDYKVRILDSAHGTDAITRVLITTQGPNRTWLTVGVGPNVIDASWDALVESVVFGLMKEGVKPR